MCDAFAAVFGGKMGSVNNETDRIRYFAQDTETG